MFQDLPKVMNFLFFADFYVAAWRAVVVCFLMVSKMLVLFLAKAFSKLTDYPVIHRKLH